MNRRGNRTERKGLNKMDKRGYVSIWMGKCTSNNDLNKYMEGQYNDDGDYLQSSFEEDFVLSMDEDFVESEVLGRGHEVIECLLEGFSYDSRIIMNLKAQDIKLEDNYNTVVILYNHKYSGEVNSIKKKNLYLRFIGSVEYE